MFAKVSAQPFPSLLMWDIKKFIVVIECMQLFHLFLIFQGTKEALRKARTTKEEFVSCQTFVSCGY
jgi:hypothetical protein